MRYGKSLAALALCLALALPATQAQGRDAYYDDDEIVPIVEAGEKDKLAETADEERAGAESGKVRPDNSSADGWFSRQEERADSAKEAKEREGKKDKDRFVQIVADQDGFAYYLDMRNAHWIYLPHSSREQIADVWVKLVPTGEGAEKDEAYSYPASYFLEHYYIRPQTQQIQFLCELEVTGRPQNAIKERPYSAKNWENLVPGSIEDEIYHAVLQKLKQEQKKKMGMTRHGENITVRDAVEEYLRISL